MKTRKKILVTILSLVFLFSITGAAFAAPADGYYVNGHRYDLTLGVNDAGYLNYLEDMAAINFDFTRVIIVSNDQYADVQAAVNAGGIAGVLQPDAQQQVGTLLPETVIPIANDGTIGPSEDVGDSQWEDLILESIEITQPADKLVYNMGDSLDITGLEVKGYYDDGSSRVLPITKSNVTGFDSSAAAASQTLTITVKDKTVEYTVEIKEQTSGPVTAVSLIENAIANFQPVNAAGKFGGEITGVTAVNKNTAYVDYLEAISASIDANKNETMTYKAKIWAKLIVNITVVNSTNTVEAFPFAEIISGSGDGSSLVTNGKLSESNDGKYYEIQLDNVKCPESIMKILDSTNEIAEGNYAFAFHEHKVKAKIKVSKTTGLVESIEGIEITGALDLSGSTKGVADGENYPTNFVCDKITMNYQS